MQVISKGDPETQEKNSLSQDAIELKKLLCQVAEVLAKLKYWLMYLKLKLKLNLPKAMKIAAWGIPRSHEGWPFMQEKSSDAKTLLGTRSQSRLLSWFQMSKWTGNWQGHRRFFEEIYARRSLVSLEFANDDDLQQDLQNWQISLRKKLKGWHRRKNWEVNHVENVDEMGHCYIFIF